MPYNVQCDKKHHNLPQSIKILYDTKLTHDYHDLIVQGEIYQHIPSEILFCIIKHNDLIMISTSIGILREKGFGNYRDNLGLPIKKPAEDILELVYILIERIEHRSILNK